MIFAVRPLELQVKKEASDGIVCKRRSSACEGPTVCSHFGQAGHHRERQCCFFFEMEVIMSSKNRLTTTTIKNPNPLTALFSCACGVGVLIFTIQVPEGWNEYPYIVSVWKLSWSTFWGAGLGTMKLSFQMSTRKVYLHSCMVGSASLLPRRCRMLEDPFWQTVPPTFPGHSQHRHYCSCRSWEVTLAIKRTQRTRSVKL